MASRRSRQTVVSSDEDFDEAPPKSASDSEESSEPSQENYDDDEDEDDEDEDDDDDDDEDDDENNNNFDSNDAAELSEEVYMTEEPVVVRPSRGTRPMRETKKRQLSFYEEDDLLDSEEEQAKPKPKSKPKSKSNVSVKLKIPKRAAAKAASAAVKMQEAELSEPEAEYQPDVSRMTERQRARLVDEEPPEKYEDSMFARMDEQLLALNRKTAKKKETAEQIALRKAENARKRAHYKTKQLEEEKRDTLNKLLKRRATKTRENVDEEAQETKQALKPRRPVVGHSALHRWVCKPEVSLLGFTE